MVEIEVPRGITAVVGGGGKTSLIWHLANRLKKTGKVIITTTTRMYPPECTTLYDPLVDDIVYEFKRTSLLAVGMRAEQGKMKGLSRYTDALPMLADYVLVEADGSRGLPLKAPAEHEPVIPRKTALVIGVCGLDGIGRQIGRVAHRPELYAELVGKTVNDVVTTEDAALVLSSRLGQRKGVATKYAVVLNKADDVQRLFTGYEIMQRLEYDTYIASLANDAVLDGRRGEK